MPLNPTRPPPCSPSPQPSPLPDRNCWFMWKNEVSATGVTAVVNWGCRPSQRVTLFRNYPFSSRRIKAWPQLEKLTSTMRWRLLFLTLDSPFSEPWKLHLVFVGFVHWTQDVWSGQYVFGRGLWRECVFHHCASWWLKIGTWGELNWGSSVGRRSIFGVMNRIRRGRRAWTVWESNNQGGDCWTWPGFSVVCIPHLRHYLAPQACASAPFKKAIPLTA